MRRAALRTQQPNALASGLLRENDAPKRPVASAIGSITAPLVPMEMALLRNSRRLAKSQMPLPVWLNGFREI